jgi:hypothetical protein
MMAKTYRDFEWIVAEYPWTEISVCFTYVRDMDPRSVVDAMTFQDRGTARGIAELYESNLTSLSLVGAAQLGSWTVAISPSSMVGVTEDYMLPLSGGREVLSPLD